MGLDCYAEEVEILNAEEKTEKFLEDEEIHNPSWEIGYWRKFWALHNWMAKLYQEKGGDDNDFNLTRVELNKEDIDVLKDQIEEFDGYEQYVEATDRFFERAYEAFENGNIVTYHGWY